MRKVAKKETPEEYEERRDRERAEVAARWRAASPQQWAQLRSLEDELIKELHAARWLAARRISARIQELYESLDKDVLEAITEETVEIPAWPRPNLKLIRGGLKR